MESLCVIRLVTTFWSDKRGVYFKKELRYIKRKSYGYNILQEEASMDLFCLEKQIINLYEVDDGLYRVEVCNISRDWESGIVDDYDLKLIPYQEQPNDQE